MTSAPRWGNFFPAFRFLILGLCFWVLAGCSQEPPASRQSYVFGTLVEITLDESGPKADAAIAAVMAEFDRLHRTYHAWQPSELSDLNTAIAAGKLFSAQPEMKAILTDARAYADRSGGLFNPAIGHLIALWGFQASSFEPHRPDPTKVAELVADGPSLDNLSFSADNIASSNSEVAIDLGGYLKGYALDRAREILRGKGIHDALINIGGNILAMGSKGDRAWRVAVRHPRKPLPLAAMELRDGEAIGTSGDYQRFFMLDGKRYCHLIDPRTGHPADGVQAATVVADSGVLSDVATKPLFIGGSANFAANTGRMGVNRALLIDRQGHILLTPDLAKRIEFLDKSTQAETVTPAYNAPPK